MRMPPVVTDPAVIEGYLTDASNLRGRAEALVRPRDPDEVAAVVAHCQAEGIPLTPTAGRTSTTGASVPDGGWLLSTEALREVLEIDVGRDRATAEAGVMLGALQEAIEQRGRLYPPDPTSRHECTLGASIACNASGARSFRYGATRRWVEALQVVLPTGELREVRRGDPIPDDWPAIDWPEPPLKTAAGYAPGRSLLDLLIGSEGTLGVVTRATLRLTDLPADVVGLVAFFDHRQAATGFVRRARDAARADPRGMLSPRCLEYYDSACLAVAAERLGWVPDGARAALFCEQEVEAGVEPEAHLEAWLEALVEAGALADDTVLATDAPGRARLYALRHAIPAGINERVVANGMRKVGTDLAVPDEALDRMMDAYEAAPVPSVLFGHMGDNHLHLNLLPRSPAELEAALAYYDELAQLALELGGTVSAEHGIGKLKRKHLEWMVGPAVIERFRALKEHLDPAGILARGNVFEPRRPL
jgi:D-lactate dehydrogenase (cytochrome)